MTTVPFYHIQKLVADRMVEMSKKPLFRVNLDKDKLWEIYLESFAPKDNAIFRQRREYDCNCCKRFIRSVGDVVTINDALELESLWDVPAKGQFAPVMQAMAEYVKSQQIHEVFYVSKTDLWDDNVIGVKKTTSLNPEGTGTDQFDHFYVPIDSKYVFRKDVEFETIGGWLSELTARCSVLQMGLSQITDSSLDIILDLIHQTSLYRGDQYKPLAEMYRNVRDEWVSIDPEDAGKITNFCWKKSCEIPAAVSKFAGTAIGTLAIDLSEGMDIDGAVASFEKKVAPENYKRTSALVTKGMVEQAEKTITELGLTSALSRRMATAADITANNILFVDRERKAVAKEAGAFDALKASVSKPAPVSGRVETVTIDVFLKNILPEARKVELFLDNKLAPNMVTLIAPADKDSGRLFSWDNNFSWAYTGDVADSIRERVTKAGGAIEGIMRCSLAWQNEDDLDLYCIEPGGYTLYYGNREHKSPCGGTLDVDANSGLGELTTTPVENIVHPEKRTLMEGTYTFGVKQYRKRSNSNVGFSAELVVAGESYLFAVDTSMKTGQIITLAGVQYSKKDGFKISSSLKSTRTSVDLWGLPSMNFHEVEMIMDSPNAWDDNPRGINQHLFFMLKGCKNPDKVRGFFNEQLRGDLSKHRKVFEILGAKTMAEPSEDQLSGVGFSRTMKKEITLKVHGAFTRILNVVF